MKDSRGGSRHYYTDAERRWLAENAGRHPNSVALAAEFNRVFGTSLTASAVWQQCRKIPGISLRKLHLRYSKEEDQFLLEHYGRLTFPEIAEKFNERFDHKVTWMGVRSHIYQTLGLTLDDPYKFAYRCRKLPVGTERMMNGYLWVKVSDEAGQRGSHDAYRRNWKMKHRIVWETLHGPVPSDSQIIFLDGNRLNFDPDNLYCIKKRMLVVITANGWWTNRRENNLAAIKWAELHYALEDSELRGREAEKKK